MSIPIMFALKDVILKESAPKELLLDKHASFIHAYETKKDDYEYVMSEYLRMSGIYWCLTAMDLMNELERMNKKEIVEFIAKCQHKNGGFSSSLGHDAHLLHTLCAVQKLALKERPRVSLVASKMFEGILTLYDSLDAVDVAKIVDYVVSLQQEDGSFFGDEFGEIDTRFNFVSMACLALLNRLDAIDVEKSVDYVLRCRNFDGGFGTRPGSESHAGQIYCCLGTLSIAGHLNRIDADELAWWLCERQCPSGGLNGRPEKLPDVCYSWWVLASLKILGRLNWIDKDQLTKFILASQDPETGGFSDRPDDIPDPFHTVFGLAGLSLLGEKSLKPVNPVFCMPENCLEKLNINIQLL